MSPLPVEMVLFMLMILKWSLGFSGCNFDPSCCLIHVQIWEGELRSVTAIGTAAGSGQAAGKSGCVRGCFLYL